MSKLIKKEKLGFQKIRKYLLFQEVYVMIKSRIGKFVLMGSIISSCVLGNSQVGFAADKSMDYKDKYSSSIITRYDMSKYLHNKIVINLVYLNLTRQQ